MSDEVFISYSRKDSVVAARIEEGLLAEGFSVWRDRRISPGQVFSEEIATTIESSRAVVWLGSLTSIDSDWVLRELEYATTCKVPIIPVYLEEDAITRMPGKFKLLFPHTHYILMTEADWTAQFQILVDGLRKVIGSAAVAPEVTTVGAQGPGPEGGEHESTEELVSVGPQPKMDLLPIDQATPMIVGVGIDVSGSMQSAIGNDSGTEKSRLEGVLESIQDLARCFRERRDDPTIEEALPLFRLFAIGFGFSDRAFKYGKLGALARRLHKDLPPIPKRVMRGAVRDLFEMSGVSGGSLSPRTIDAHWEQIHSGIWDQRLDLFGDTPICGGLNAVEKQFLTEFNGYDGTPQSALFLLSDGKSSDGDPVETCLRITSLGTIVCCCYLTSSDMPQTKQLYAEPQADWPEGARTLFRCATVLSEDALFLEPLRSRGWNATEGDRLFALMNHSSLISEFMGLIFDVSASEGY